MHRLSFKVACHTYIPRVVFNNITKNDASVRRMDIASQSLPSNFLFGGSGYFLSASAGHCTEPYPYGNQAKYDAQHYIATGYQEFAAAQ